MRLRDPIKKNYRSLAETVEIGAGAGWTHAQIAKALQMTVKQLRAKYGKELAEGPTRRRMDVLRAVYDKALQGNIAAARAYLGLGDDTHRARPLKRKERPVVAPRVLAAAVGKKERQQADATTAHVGTEWESLLDPNRAAQ
jgi:hypothetical protein